MALTETIEIFIEELKVFEKKIEQIPDLRAMMFIEYLETFETSEEHEKRKKAALRMYRIIGEIITFMETKEEYHGIGYELLKWLESYILI